MLPMEQEDDLMLVGLVNRGLPQRSHGARAQNAPLHGQGFVHINTDLARVANLEAVYVLESNTTLGKHGEVQTNVDHFALIPQHRTRPERRRLIIEGRATSFGSLFALIARVLAHAAT